MENNEVYLDSLPVLPDQAYEISDNVASIVAASGLGMVASGLYDHGKQAHQSLTAKIENDLKPLGERVVKAAFPYSEEEWQDKQVRKT